MAEPEALRGLLSLSGQEEQGEEAKAVERTPEELPRAAWQR